MKADWLHRSRDDELEVVLLDVGHGSCIFIDTGKRRILIDTGPNGSVLEFLEERNVTSVDLVIISHADQDHIGGLSALLSNGVTVRKILWNTDGLKQTRLWKNLCYQLDDLSSAGVVTADQEAAADTIISDVGDRVRIQLLAPRLRLRRLGVGNRDSGGSKIGSNTLSVVARVLIDGEPVLLIPGDLDSVGFSHLSDPELPDLTAKYLVLPHHGGAMSTSSSQTAAAISSLTKAVGPEVIFVSNGRATRMDNPRPEVLEAALSAAPAAMLCCTQLSRSCSVNAIRRDKDSSIYSVGWRQGHSCTGSVLLLSGSAGMESFDKRDHDLFLESFVPQARCMEVRSRLAASEEAVPDEISDSQNASIATTES